MINSVLETHHKNIIIWGGFALSVAGWFLWQIILSRMYPAEYDIYLVRSNFLENFGPQLSWWAICLLPLATLVILELVVQSIRRVYFPTDQDLMQRMEKDVRSKRTMKDHAARLENGEGEGMEMHDVPAAKSESYGQKQQQPQQPGYYQHTAAPAPPRPTHPPTGDEYATPAEYPHGPDSPAFDRPVSVRDFPVAERPVPGRSDSEAWTGTASYYYSRADPDRPT